MRLPWILPRRAMQRVLMVLSTSLVAVPAFSRVLPASTSGPVITRMSTSHSAGTRSEGTQAKKTVAAPAARPAASAP